MGDRPGHPRLRLPLSTARGAGLKALRRTAPEGAATLASDDTGGNQPRQAQNPLRTVLRALHTYIRSRWSGQQHRQYGCL